MEWYIIQSKKCDFVLNLKKPEVRGGKCGDLELDEQRGGVCQLWQHDDQKRLVTKGGDALDVENWHTGGRNIIARKPILGMNQKFEFDDEGYITHVITKKVLDVEGDMECGAQLVLSEKGASDCQLWEKKPCEQDE